MTGLKDSHTSISDDGLTVSVKAESAATAREIAADLEAGVRKAEGGWGAKFNAGLARSLNRFDETLGIYGDRQLTMLRDGMFICAMAMAIFAWYRTLPGYEILMCVIGVLIVWAVKASAGSLDKAEQAGDRNLVNFYRVIIVIGFVLELIASSSLQASVAVDRETGREDINTQIANLENEQSNLMIALARPPSAPAAAIQSRIDGYLTTPMVNRNGSQLTRTVGQMYEATACNPDSEGGAAERYYIGIYCGTLNELKAEKAEAEAYEAASARFAEIGPQIAGLQKIRPAAASTFSLAQKGGDMAWWLSLVIPVGLTFCLMLAMTVMAYLAGRAKRTPPVAATPGAAP